MENILDFTREFDVGLFDQVVNTFFTTTGPESQRAQQVIAQFQEHPEAWSRVDAILDQSSSLQSKYIALQVLEKLIQTRWKVLPEDQRQGIRNFVVGSIVKVSSDDVSLHRQRAFVNKLNLTLVQILKKEWPQHWPTFIPEMVTSSRSNVSICENNMVILKLFSEEIFEYSSEQMTHARTHDMKDHMWQEIAEVFNLMKEVLEVATKPSLIVATLDAFHRYLYWLPYGYTFETNVIDILCNRFLQAKEFRNLALKCLTEIGHTNVTHREHLDKSAQMFEMTMRSVGPAVLSAPDINQAYEDGSDEEQEFILNVVLFVTSSLNAHLGHYEKKLSREVMVTSHHCLLQLSRVEEREVFKVCLEYWIFLVRQLYDESEVAPLGGVPLLSLGGGSGTNAASTAAAAHRQMYAEVLSPLRAVMIEHMVKPEEVLIVENDEGEIVREFVKETDTITLYKSMRECLVYLTHLDVADTESIMNKKLARQMDGSEWSWNNLNKLCWAIGSISGAMSEDMEKRFLVVVIKDLLGLCEMKRGKDNKAVVASNIMYVVGQYPRFLKAHWKFLKTVANKLFEFMHELHEGVQDMACDTFIKIATKCKRHFVTQQYGEAAPFVEEIISHIDTITADLAPQQIHTFYEAVGHMIAAQTNPAAQEALVEACMKIPNLAWNNVLDQVKQDITVLNDQGNIKILANVLKTNVATCSSVGAGFLSQIGRIYVDMLSLYTQVSAAISREVDAKGLVATKMPHIRAMRTIKKETLKLVQTYVSRAEDLHPVRQNMLPMFFDAVLRDYRTNVDAARDAEVLTTLATIVTRLGAMVTDKVALILDNVFEPTLSMISKDFTEYPEHRTAFYNLLRAINASCFSALLQLPPPQFQVVLDSIVWAFKHTTRDIADTGLSILLELLNNVSATEPGVLNSFARVYFVGLTQDVFFVLTDSDHKNGFRLQCMILSRMFHLIESGRIYQPLYDPAQLPNGTNLGANMSNRDYFTGYIVNLLANAFPHLARSQLESFASGLFDLTDNLEKFMSHVRDFLVQMKEFSADGSGDGAGSDQANGRGGNGGGGSGVAGGSAIEKLSLVDPQQELEAKRQAEMERALKVPGMVKPSDLPTMDDD